MVQDMTTGKPAKLIAAFFLPLLAGNLFQQLYNLVDTIIVGKGLGDAALAAVGSTGSLHFFIFGFITGLTNGTAIPMAQAFGANDLPRLRKTVTMALLSCGALSVLLTAGTVAGTRGMLTLLQTPGDLMPLAKAYLVVIFLGLPVTVAYNFCSGLLRALGDSRTPFAAVLIASVGNLLLDVLFVLLLPFGVAGAAWATVLAQLGSVGFCVWRLRKLPQVALKPADWALEWPLIGEILRLGLPVGLMNSVTAAGGMLLWYFVNGMGAAYTASYAASTKILSFFEQPAMTLGMAMATFAGQNLGAGKLSRIREGVRCCVGMSLLLDLPLGALEIFCPELLVSIMISEPQNIALCAEFLPICGVCLWILGLLFVFRNTCQAMGDTLRPMFSGVLELALRIGMVLWLQKLLGFFGVAAAEVSAWVGAALFLFVCYLLRMRRCIRQAAGGIR